MTILKICNFDFILLTPRITTEIKMGRMFNCETNFGQSGADSRMSTSRGLNGRYPTRVKLEPQKDGTLLNYSMSNIEANEQIISEQWSKNCLVLQMNVVSQSSYQSTFIHKSQYDWLLCNHVNIFSSHLTAVKYTFGSVVSFTPQKSVV